MKFSREDLLWGFNTLVACGWGSGNDGTGDKMMVPFSELPVHRRESAQKVHLSFPALFSSCIPLFSNFVAQATNRGFISAAKEYQAGEELTFDYGLLNDAVLAFYGANQPCSTCARARMQQLILISPCRHSHSRLPRP